MARKKVTEEVTEPTGEVSAGEVPAEAPKGAECPDCQGSGLRDAETLCPTCAGSGKVK